MSDDARDLARHVLKFFDPHELEDAFTHHLRAVVAQEREACAKIAEAEQLTGTPPEWAGPVHTIVVKGVVRATAKSIAAAIRARATT